MRDQKTIDALVTQLYAIGRHDAIVQNALKTHDRGYIDWDEMLLRLAVTLSEFNRELIQKQIENVQNERIVVIKEAR